MVLLQQDCSQSFLPWHCLTLVAAETQELSPWLLLLLLLQDCFAGCPP
jgi:hypothetical protein